MYMRILVWTLLCVASVMAPRLFADPVSKVFAIAKVGSFFIGGEEVNISETGIFANVDDKIRVGQARVIYLLPDTDQSKVPVVMMPGFGLAAEIYLETADGREGWALNFLRRGHPVYVFEPANSVRSGFNPEPFNQAQQGRASNSPRLFTWGKEHVWRRWGLGPEYGVPFADGRFDVSSYEQIVAAFSAVSVDKIEGKKNIDSTLAANMTATHKLLKRIGPAGLLVHSAAGVTAFAAARQWPELVTAVINVEPVGCPVKNLKALKSVPILSVFGDHLEVREQIRVRQQECQLTVDYALSQKTIAAMFALPDMGIKGNSHLLMSEDNSADIASLIINWLATVPVKD